MATFIFIEMKINMGRGIEPLIYIYYIFVFLRILLVYSIKSILTILHFDVTQLVLVFAINNVFIYK
jgi:hypothetical protein